MEELTLFSLIERLKIQKKQLERILDDLEDKNKEQTFRYIRATGRLSEIDDILELLRLEENEDDKDTL